MCVKPSFFLLLILGLIFNACGESPPVLAVDPPTAATAAAVTLTVLGNVQDAGSPHIACRKECCRELFSDPDPDRQVTALGLIDREADQQFLFEASPDLARQAKRLSVLATSGRELPDGIFLTHAHIGHYVGLMYLGREATNADATPVYAMPRMQEFLRTNGPWSQLVDLENIALRPLRTDSTLQLTTTVSVTPFRVPHRDEFSETVGYRIEGPRKSALFIPDIDKWEKWDRRIEDAIAAVDYALVDGTFFNGAELNTRDISEIPHPFVSESMERFSSLPAAERAKIYFIHFNHTNRLLVADSPESAAVREAGMQVARYGLTLDL